MIEDQIFKRIDDIKKETKCQEVTKFWKKLYGDICNRVFTYYIRKSIYPSFEVSDPNAYIKGFPTEFDLLVINFNAKPIVNTNCYDPDDVKCGIEFKAHGVFAKKEDLKRKFEDIKRNYENVNQEHPRINFIYLTLEEVSDPIRKGSINYFKETVNGLLPYRAFCLRNSRGKKEIRYGEWDKFIIEILSAKSQQNVSQ